MLKPVQCKLQRKSASQGNLCKWVTDSFSAWGCFTDWALLDWFSYPTAIPETRRLAFQSSCSQALISSFCLHGMFGCLPRHSAFSMSSNRLWLGLGPVFLPWQLDIVQFFRGATVSQCQNGGLSSWEGGNWWCYSRRFPSHRLVGWEVVMRLVPQYTPLVVTDLFSSCNIQIVHPIWRLLILPVLKFLLSIAWR